MRTGIEDLSGFFKLPPRTELASTGKRRRCHSRPAGTRFEKSVETSGGHQLHPDLVVVRLDRCKAADMDQEIPAAIVEAAPE